MFNWFRKKIELKNDKSIMASVYQKGGVKIGSEIIVPGNYECLIYHNSKYYTTLTCGTHKVDTIILPKLIEKQLKRNAKLKRVKFVSHYICTSNQQVELKLKKEKYLIEFCVTSTYNFAELMLLYTYKVDDSYVYPYLQDLFAELIKSVHGDYKQITDTKLLTYGIKIINILPSSQKTSTFTPLIDLSNTGSQDAKNIPTYASTSTNEITHDTNTTLNADTTKNTISTPSNNSAPTSTQQISTCPKCGQITKFTTSYCLRCGTKLE